MMKRLTWGLGVVIVAGVASAVAEPPNGRGRPPAGPEGGPRGNPVIEALDVDHDHLISGEELKNATAALLTLDQNHDGTLSEGEFGPLGGPGMGRGPNGRPGGERKLQTNVSRGRPDDVDDRGGPPGHSIGKGDDPVGGPMPGPERMFDQAMEFDADNDGKLSREELKKFVDDVNQHRLQPGPRRPVGGRGPAGDSRRGPPDDAGSGARPRRSD